MQAQDITHRLYFFRGRAANNALSGYAVAKG